MFQAEMWLVQKRNYDNFYNRPVILSMELVPLKVNKENV